MRACKTDDEIMLTESFLFRDSIKEVAGRRYDAEEKAWFIPLSESNAALVKMLGAEVADDLREFVKADKPQGEIKPVQRMPIRAAPYKHQIAAFNFAMDIFTGKGGDAK